MKSLKFAKFHIASLLSGIRNFYLVFSLFLVFLIVINSRGANATSSGIEFSSMVFVFILGLNSFKNSFYFSQANNISRKVFFKGATLTMLSVCMVMSIIDLIIGRVYNNFIASPTIFDMFFGNLRGLDMWSENGIRVWVQQNDISTLLGTTIFQFALYSLFFVTGMFITLIYYRSNNPLKILISIIPVVFIILLNTIKTRIPNFLWRGMAEFVSLAFLKNSYIAALSFGIIGTMFIGFTYLLTRRVTVKE